MANPLDLFSGLPAAAPPPNAAPSAVTPQSAVQGSPLALFADTPNAQPQTPPNGQPMPQQPADNGASITNVLTGGNKGIANSIDSAIYSGLDVGTAGVAPRAAAWLASGISHLIPFGNSLSPSQAYALIKQRETALASSNPYASFAGDAAGLLGGGIAAKALLPALAEVLPSAGAATSSALGRVATAVGGNAVGDAAATALNTAGSAAASAGQAGGALAGAAGKAVSAALAPTGGGALGNVVQAAKLGAVGAGVNEMATEGTVVPNANTLMAMGEGALIGPIIAKVAGMGSAATAELAQRFSDMLTGTTVGAALNRAATGALASLIKDDPQKLQQAAQVFQQITGQPPSIAAMMDAADGGRAVARLRSMAANNPEVAQALQGHLDAFNAQQPNALAQTITKAVPPPSAALPDGALAMALTKPGPAGQELGPLNDTLNGLMDNARATATKQGTPWNTTRLTLTPDDLGILQDGGVRRALRANPTDEGLALRQKVSATVDDLTDDQGKPIVGMISNRLTVDDIDAIRQSLRQYGRAASNSHIQGDFGGLATQVEDLAARETPTYAAGLQAQRDAGDYLRGFQAAQTGTLPADATGDVAASLQTAAGNAGYTAGAARRAGSAALTNGPQGAASTADQLANNAGVGYQLGEALPGPAGQQVQSVASQVQSARQTLQAAVPSSPVEHPEPQASDMLEAGVDAAMGMNIRGAAKISRLLYGLVNSKRLDPRVADKLGQMLTSTDPAVQKQALTAVGKLQLSAGEAQQLRGALSFVAGANVGQNNAPFTGQ